MSSVFVVVLLVGILTTQTLPLWLKFLAVILGLVGSGAIYALWKSREDQRRQVEEWKRKAQFLEEQSLAKFENIFRISHQFATATDENQILNWALELMLEAVNAKAASFTPIDELGATLKTRVHGEMPGGVSKEWLEYLSSPTVRKKCPNCQQTDKLVDHCPLLYSTTDELRIYCIPIRRSNQELGIFHLFFDRATRFDREQELLLRLILDQIALSLEGARLRSREAIAHVQLESVKQQLDVGFFIEELLKGLGRGLNVQTAMVSVWDQRLKKAVKAFVFGEIDEELKESLLTLFAHRNLGKMGRVRSDSPAQAKEGQIRTSVLTIPIPIEKKELIGVLQIILPAERELTGKQEEMLNAIVTQISFLLQNANLLAEVEIKAILQERIRLAREIHDGLAQTLGFLKLKVSQLKAYLDQGDIDRAKQTTQLLYEAVSDAYLEARHAIDQLRVSVYDAPLAELLHETLDEFSESSGIPFQWDVKPESLRLPVEINAQLVRIVQESLSNVRKHAHAHLVQIHTLIKGDWLILEVRDDGIGFLPEEVSPHSQYGLMGMKERAELIGAELQIISQPNEGTTVQVRLPLSQIERSWQT